MVKIKNLHYLNMYPEIEESFKKAVERADEGELQEAFFNLRYCLEGLVTELIKHNDWYKMRVAAKDSPSTEEIIKRLKIERIITDKQKAIFTAIRIFGNQKVHYGKNRNIEGNESETLRKFNTICVELDKELPSIMAHLGIGGSTRFDYVDENNKVKNEEDNKTDNAQKRASNSSSYSSKYSQTSGSNTRSAYQDSFIKRVKYMEELKLKKFEEQQNKEHIATMKRIHRKTISKPIFYIKFIISLLIAIYLLNIVFINKIPSSNIEKAYNEFSLAEKEFASTVTPRIFNSIGNMFSNIKIRFVDLVEFLKFE